MKKIMSMLLALVLLLSLTACGEEKETSSKRKDRDSEEASENGGLFDRFFDEEKESEEAEPEEKPEDLYKQVGSEGLNYAPDPKTGGYTLTGIGRCTTPDIVIASSYNGKPVTAIHSAAFTESATTKGVGIAPSAITSISIPQTVVRIDPAVFAELAEYCTSLVYTECEGIQYLGNAYNPYHVLVKAINKEMTSCTIQPNTGIIGPGAFARCDALTAVHVPEGVVEIGREAFYNCKNMKELTLPNSLRYVGAYVINHHSQPDKMICTVYEGVRYLGNESNPYLYLCRPVDKAKTSYTVHPDTKFIGSGAFEDIKSFTEITIPNGVISIGSGAFLDSKALRSVELPESVTVIEGSAFADCESLETIILSSNTTYIDGRAFDDCVRLNMVTIPEKVAYIGPKAFSQCESLTQMTFLGDAPKFGNKAFNVSNFTAYYNADNPTWTADVMQSYGGTVKWEPMS